MGHFRTSNHKTFLLLQWTNTFLVFASPKVYSNKSLVWKSRDLERFMAALSMEKKPGTIWVCMSLFITAICIITSKSLFSGFRGSLSFVSGGIQLIPWRTCWLYLVLLWCPCPPLPGRCVRDLHVLLVLELAVIAGARSCSASLQSGFPVLLAGESWT